MWVVDLVRFTSIPHGLCQKQQHQGFSLFISGLNKSMLKPTSDVSADRCPHPVRSIAIAYSQHWVQFATSTAPGFSKPTNAATAVSFPPNNQKGSRHGGVIWRTDISLIGEPTATFAHFARPRQELMWSLAMMFFGSSRARTALNESMGNL